MRLGLRDSFRRIGNIKPAPTILNPKRNRNPAFSNPEKKPLTVALISTLTWKPYNFKPLSSFFEELIELIQTSPGFGHFGNLGMQD